MRKALIVIMAVILVIVVVGLSMQNVRTRAETLFSSAWYWILGVVFVVAISAFLLQRALQRRTIPVPPAPRVATPPASPTILSPNPIITPQGRWGGGWNIVGPFWTRWIGVAIVIFYFLLSTVGWYLSNPDGFQWGWVFLTVGLCHFAVSLKVIREQELAVLIWLGIILQEIKSGPHIVLFPLFYIRRETKNSVHVDFGTIDESNMDRAKRSETSESWYVMPEPVRINWGDINAILPNEADRAPYKGDPYANTLTTDPHIYFRVKIVSFKILIEEVGGLAEAIERIRDTCVSALSELAGQTFVAKARHELGTLSLALRQKVEYLIGDPEGIAQAQRDNRPIPRSWGLDIEEVRIKDVGAPHDANRALVARAATIAKADGEATSIIRLATANRINAEEAGLGAALVKTLNADADRYATVQKGEADGEAERARLRGKALGLEAMEEVAGVDPNLVLQLETLSAGFQHGKVVVLPAGGFAELAGAVAGVQAVLKSSSVTPPETPST